MLDWLRRDPRTPPTIALAGRELPIVVRRLEHARRLTMRLAPDGSEVRISMPRWGRTVEAVRFAASRHEWLERQLIAIPVSSPLQAGSMIRFRGQSLMLAHDPAARRAPLCDGETLQVGGAAASLESRLRRWLQGQAKGLLTTDVADYCRAAGLPVSPLALSAAKRRWGSCAASGAIRINWRLIMAPDFVRRSVVAHEVAHLVHFNHSPAFHACLKGLFDGDLAAADSWLKREGRSLYQPFG